MLTPFGARVGVMALNLEKKLDRAIADELKQQTFTALGLAVFRSHEILLEMYAGKTARGNQAQAIGKHSVFDLASLTKVFGLAPLVFDCVQKKIIHPLGLVSELIFPGFRTEIDSSWHALMSHCAGLEAWRDITPLIPAGDNNPIWEGRDLAANVLALPRIYPPGAATVYSDLGFILGGQALSLWTQRPLNELFEAHCQSVWEVDGIFYRPEERVSPSHRVLTEEAEPGPYWVHDQNTRRLNGMAGHAGLFATLPACIAMGQKWIQVLKDTPSAQSDRINIMLKPRYSFAGARPMFWDIPQPGGHGGDLISPNALGHLGYTGTSIWLDRERDLGVLVLSNRSYPDDSGKAEIKSFRRRVHDLVWTELT